MGTTPTTVNGAVKTADSIISAVIYDVGVNAAEIALKAEVPFLALPGVSQVLDILLRFIAKYIYAGLANFATLQIITFQTDSERSAYATAEAKLRAAHITGDAKAIDQATVDFKSAFQSLVHYDGSASS